MSHPIHHRCQTARLKRLPLLLLLAWGIILAGCGGLPSLPIPAPDGLPSVEELPDLLQDLPLPDLSQIPGLPQIEDLPQLQTPEGGVVYLGPTELGLEVGQTLAGTDIQLVGVSGDEAEFRVAGMRSVRRSGDSLDYSGPWRGIDGVDYAARLRVYLIRGSGVRVAGVHRLVVYNINPSPTPLSDRPQRQIPFTANVAVGKVIPGTTYLYGGMDDRGARLDGLPAGEYPYYKMGDSISWNGQLRSDIPVSYRIRVLFYNEGSLQVGGVVHLALPE